MTSAGRNDRGSPAETIIPHSPTFTTRVALGRPFLEPPAGKRLAPLGLAYRHPAAMEDDELAVFRRITQRRQRAEVDWREEIRRLFDAGHNRGDRCGGRCSLRGRPRDRPPHLEPPARSDGVGEPPGWPQGFPASQGTPCASGRQPSDLAKQLRFLRAHHPPASNALNPVLGSLCAARSGGVAQRVTQGIDSSRGAALSEAPASPPYGRVARRSTQWSPPRYEISPLDCSCGRR